MQRRAIRWIWSCLFVMAVFWCLPSATVYAELESANYHFDETALGSTGSPLSSSPNYQSANSAGDISVGESASGDYQFIAGAKTTHDPTLAFTINSADAGFGAFSASSTATASAGFSVLNYTSYGYAVQVAGEAPSNGTHTISAMSSTAASHAGQEQFGMNLVANTDPAVFGQDPDNGDFGQGAATPNYGTTDMFRFVNGETIAMAPKSSGVTNYTVSYIVNVTSLTPGGQYAAKQTLIVTGVY